MCAPSWTCLVWKHWDAGWVQRRERDGGKNRIESERLVLHVAQRCSSQHIDICLNSDCMSGCIKMRTTFSKMPWLWILTMWNKLLIWCCVHVSLMHNVYTTLSRSLYHKHTIANTHATECRILYSKWRKHFDYAFSLRIQWDLYIWILHSSAQLSFIPIASIVVPFSALTLLLSVCVLLLLWRTHKIKPREACAELSNDREIEIELVWRC